MNLVETGLRSSYFLMIVALSLGFALLMVPGGSGFFSGRFLAILFSGVLGALWASAKIRRDSDGSVVVYPLLISAIIGVAVLAKSAGRIVSSAG